MQKSTYPRNIKTRLIIFVIAVSSGFLLDRVLKNIAQNQYSDKEFFILPKLFAFLLHKNAAAAFSIQVNPYIISIATATILGIIGFFTIYWLIYNKKYFFAGFIVFGGGISNFVDRLFHGYVIDYLYLRPYSYFNLADVMILTGCLLFVYLIWQYKKKVYGK